MSALICAVCGEPACISSLIDPFGKSDAMRHLCSKHGPQFRDPQDVAEIERLHLEWIGMKSEVQCCHKKIERLRAALQACRYGDTTPSVAAIAKEALGLPIETETKP